MVGCHRYMPTVRGRDVRAQLRAGTGLHCVGERIMRVMDGDPFHNVYIRHLHDARPCALSAVSASFPLFCCALKVA